jgi:hypothetical protein
MPEVPPGIAAPFEIDFRSGRVDRGYGMKVLSQTHGAAALQILVTESEVVYRKNVEVKESWT